jgi:hypothetical protein
VNEPIGPKAMSPRNQVQAGSGNKADSSALSWNGCVRKPRLRADDFSQINLRKKGTVVVAAEILFCRLTFST